MILSGKIFLKNIFSYASDNGYKNLYYVTGEFASAEYTGRGNFFCHHD